LAGLKLALEEFFVAFPDIQETIDDIIGEGNMVASWVTIRATHRGPFMGVPATDRRVTFTIQELSRIEDGKVQEQRVSFDLFGLMTQTSPSDKREEGDVIRALASTPSLR
jgi:predicted ester cyclase